MSRPEGLGPDPSISVQLGVAECTCKLSDVEGQTGSPLRPAGYSLSSGVIIGPRLWWFE